MSYGMAVFSFPILFSLLRQRVFETLSRQWIRGKPWERQVRGRDRAPPAPVLDPAAAAPEPS